MPISRLARLRAGSIHPTAVSLSTGIVVDANTGILHTTPLQQEDTRINTRIDDLYWKDPINSIDDLSDNLTPANYRLGEVYYNNDDFNLYIYAGTSNIPAGLSTFQPQAWTDNGQTEQFITLSTGIDVQDYATKNYVDTEITNLIGGAPATLNTLQELVTALGNDPNFATTITLRLTALENDKADLTQVYTKTEIDTLELELITRINNSIDPFAKPADYVIGDDNYDDSQNLSTWYENNKGEFSTATPTNVLLKPGSTIDPSGLVIDRPGVFISGLNAEAETGNFSTIQNLVINITEVSSVTEYIAFSNLTINSLSTDNDSNPITIIFENCVFTDTDALPTYIANQNSEIIFTFKNCKFNSVATQILFNATTATFYRCSFLSNSNSLLSFANASNVKILNSYLNCKVSLLNNSYLFLSNSYVEFDNDEPIINIANNQQVDLPKMFATKLVFKTLPTYSSTHISGDGYCYLDFNCIDIGLLNAQVDGSFVKKPATQATINNGDGMTLAYFLKPAGYDFFFYDDEMAQDAVASMITAATHSTGVSFTYNDASNHLALNLNLSSAQLSDVNDIAKKTTANIFFQENTFQQLTTFQNTDHSRIDSDAANITAATITTLHSTTKPVTDNSTHVATTAYVTTAVANLEADFEDLDLHELNDVGIVGQVEQGQVLTYSTSPTLTWTNAKIASTDLSDTNLLIRQGDSTFLLNGLTAPSRNNQTGDIEGAGGQYRATHYVPAWNGQFHTDLDGNILTGAYVPTSINEVILPATEVPENIIDYNGAGKIQIASTQEVELGTTALRAVVPQYLRSHYLRTDATNLNDTNKTLLRNNLNIASEFVQLTGVNVTEAIATDLRTSLKFPNNPTDGYVLKWNSDQYSEYKTSLFNYDYSLIDSTTSNSTRHNAETSSFYDIKTSANETFYLDIPTALNNQGAVIKVRKHNGDLHQDAGTLSIMLQAPDEYILSADNVKREVSNQINPQIDLLLEGHTVELIASVDENGTTYWHAFGYYHNAQNQNQPDPPVNIQQDAIEDAIENLFSHTHHAPALNVQYNDPNHRLEITTNFATQAQATAGTISNLPIAPNTLLGVTNVINGTINSLRTYVDNAFLEKSDNLSDLVDASQARTNLGLGTSAIVDTGFDTDLIPTVATTFSNGYVAYDGAGLVTQSLPVSSTTVQGIAELATFQEIGLATDSTKIVTPELLKDGIAWNDVNNLLLQTIKNATNTIQYQKSNAATLNALSNNHYSLSTVNGSIIVNLPDLSQISAGQRIIIKYAVLTTQGDTITIDSYQNQTIDRDSANFVLDFEGQAITLVSDGVDNWEII